MEKIKLLYIDLFCGAGGTSTGVENARYKGGKCAKVIACVNHDANAIASHAANHPDALHFTEDIRKLELSPLVSHIEKMKAVYPGALVVLWASLECTNFSKAKGGKPRNPDSRTLGNHLFRYVEVINPDYVQIENVEEFMKNIDEWNYEKWRDNIKAYGYNFKHLILNAADYGAYTSRKRFFGIFAKKDLPVIFPTPTHTKKGGKDLFGKLEKWKPVKDVLDFSDEGESIFNREKPKKPFCDKTLERIYAGLIKFVAVGKDNFISAYYGVTKNFNRTYEQTAKSTDEPCGVLTTENRFAKVQCSFIQQRNSGNPKSKIVSVERPARTITTTGGNMDLVQSYFLGTYCGSKGNQKSNVFSIENPSPTVTVFERLSLVFPHFIVNEYSGGGQNSSIDEVCPAVLTIPKQKIVKCKFIDQQYGNSKPSVDENPLGCITSNPKYNLVNCHYLMNPQFQSARGSVDKPCFTLIGHMDKMPPYLIVTEAGQISIEVYETDSEPMRRIKEFMTLYGIIDIKIRMLKIPELKLIMGFSKDYTLIGTKAEQKKFIGNAVEVNMARVLCEALIEKLYEVGIFKMTA